MSSGERQVRDAGPTWRALFPQMGQVLAEIADTHVSDSSDDLAADICRSIATAAVYGQSRVPIGTLMPSLAHCHEVPWDMFDTRERNALLRRGVEAMPDLLPWTATDLLDLPHVGAGTAVGLIAKLAQHALVVPPDPADEVLRVSFSDNGERLAEAAEYTGLTERQRALAGLLDDVLVLAKWQALRGLGSAPVVQADEGQEATQRVKDARNRLVTVVADELIDTAAERPAAVVEQRLTELEPRELIILQQRTFADDPITLDALGLELDLTRERVRQIEKKMNEALKTDLVDGPVGDLAAAIRSRIGNVCSLQYLLAEFPALDEEVRVVGQPAWRVVDRLDSSFEIEHGWAAVPTVSKASSHTLDAARAAADDMGLVDIPTLARALEIALPARQRELHAWLEHVGLLTYHDRIVVEARSIPDWAVIVLNHESRSLSLAEIVDLMPVDRAETSVRNAISADPRITRVDRDSYGLAAWGLEEYAGIRELIGRYVDARGGEANLDELVTDLTERFDVAETSVRAYAMAFPYVVQAGRVMRRTEGTQERGRLSDSRRTYARGTDLLYRFPVTEEHWRGSGSVMPTDLARLIGLREGETLHLESPNGQQSVYWTGLQPSLGSIKRLVERLDVQPGQWVMAAFDSGGTFDLRPLDMSEKSGLQLAQALTGTEAAAPSEARSAMAEALGLPPHSPWTSLVAVAQNRGEDDLVNALLQDPDLFGVDPPEQSPSALQQGTSVDEILDLL